MVHRPEVEARSPEGEGSGENEEQDEREASPGREPVHRRVGPSAAIDPVMTDISRLPRGDVDISHDPFRSPSTGRAM
jgi:hypothetical protein